MSEQYKYHIFKSKKKWAATVWNLLSDRISSTFSTKQMRHSEAEEQAEVQHRVCVEGSEWRQDKSTVPLLLVMVC